MNFFVKGIENSLNSWFKNTKINSDLISEVEWEQLTVSELANFVLEHNGGQQSLGSLTISEDGWEILSSPSTPLPKSSLRKKPLQEEEWVLRLAAGNVADSRRRIHEGGISEVIRPIAWKYLLGVQQYNSSLKIQASIREKQSSEYQRNKLQWKELANSKLDRDCLDTIIRVEKDVIRTDRQNPFYPKTEGDQSIMSIHNVVEENEKLTILRDILMTWTICHPIGFVQGMADFASLFLIVMNDELDAFSCFSKFMETKAENFQEDGSGIKRQLDLLRKLAKLLDFELFQNLPQNLFCSFRWLLVCFRREFNFDDIVTIWDQLLAQTFCTDWQIFLCFGMFMLYRDEILQVSDADELLHFFQTKALRINVDKLLVLSSEHYFRFERLARSRGFPISRDISLATILSQLEEK